ncbi:hypothetical protein AAHE18_09G148600 [Arachis hypogaea]|uniref:Uncharacterized protein n=1 Tax=Arachis hypogaea TaxID=3818 RepID=A0A445BGR0_ARAHY|nr:uncharacterized protein DS421_9g275470 [Arachis hypogaea]RYR37872.1 hypothetical protein Ahy_A09g042783 [Arachis hypogaea]
MENTSRNSAATLALFFMAFLIISSSDMCRICDARNVVRIPCRDDSYCRHDFATRNCKCVNTLCQHPPNCG